MADFDPSDLPERWEAILGDRDRSALSRELRTEIGRHHALWDVDFEVVARRDDRDDLLLRVLDQDFGFAEVHLTWSGRRELDPRWPGTTLFRAFREWLDVQEKA